MQIDLLATPANELGLISSRTYDHDVAGIIYDVGEQTLTLEFGQAMDSLKCNIPVGEDFGDMLRRAQHLHVCAVEKGRMTYAKQVPLMKVSNEEDDYFHNPLRQGVMPLQTWLTGAKFAQSVHRDNLGDTSSNGGIMHRAGLSRATLQVAPQLAKALVQEQSLAQRVQLNNTPRATPPSLGPGSSHNLNLGRMSPKGPTSSSDEGNNQ